MRLMHKLNKQVLIGALPLHNIELRKEIDTKDTIREEVTLHWLLLLAEIDAKV